MEKSELYFSYAMWLVIFLCVKFLFDYISKKTSNLGKLLAGTILPTWFLLAVIWFIRDLSYNNVMPDFIFKLADTLPQILFIGGITFIYKYRKFKNKFKAQ